MKRLPAEVHTVGCYRITDRPIANVGMTPSIYEQGDCHLCRARIWIGARCREYLKTDLLAKACCFQCVAKISVLAEETVYKPLADSDN